ncbi:hypothetical protein AvCA_06850 [Azotobacter vinelandii CA]|uniref:DUF5666 domain-containing protein n=2 Tax=Azotobacter vinelandii TaxID=354 RepID=C1DLI7_AZOVD|nr:hypothetical protein [Azotobacter vinelandii]ACO76935.1 conserved hypothetical protein [Azotobacter vinelandii DJ]AGK17222.1 hypothetical protein AvCA_06850 [Azotobacter vinelandii CA]AGK19449.1 hypothetical protein AvCA6_06850 [Azotobacter vinelandii CA6]WKN22680.1 hypothetical protein AVAEIV_000679 [Azotobacter vinelandii]SFX40844.1 hypothetical protein SAMN04244547_01460 [Azotobacter vinelandii]
MHNNRLLLVFLLALLLVAALLIGASMGLASQGWDTYDTGRRLTIEAPLKQVLYRRPQTEVRVDYRGAEWKVLLGPSSRLLSRGAVRNDLRPGRPVILIGYPRKDGSAEMRAERLILDGRTLELR